MFRTPSPYAECCCSNACVAVAVAAVEVVVAGAVAATTTNMVPCRAIDLINYRMVALIVAVKIIRRQR